MEMADQARKKAIERALHIDRFEYYAKIAKTKLASIETDLESSTFKITTIMAELERTASTITRLQQSAAGFEDNKFHRQQELQSQIATIRQEMVDFKLPDLEKLKDKWALIAKINQKLGEYRTQINQTTSKIAELKGTKSYLENKIVRWGAQSGRICTACEQTIPLTHVTSKIEPLQAELVVCDERMATLSEEYKQLKDVLRKTEELVSQKQPSLTMRDAQSIHSAYNTKASEIERLERQITNIGSEKNPHEQSIKEAEASITKRQTQLDKIKTDNEQKLFLSQHYQYVFKAYNDRTKIKSYVFQEHIPYINERIKHYLGVFNLDVHIELTSSLGISSNLWGYEFESGGERKRTDVAFMLAMFDFHEQMYGRQCNILVLDEVDGRLDDDGIESLINIIKDDLSTKVESIMIISHRSSMWDTFPNEIKVVRKDRFSHLRIAV
jgi:DNA repair exonuclease SbcCD ATPase subunit